MPEPNDDENMADAQTETIDEYDTHSRVGARKPQQFTIEGETITLKREEPAPHKSARMIDCEISEQAINQYTFVETSGRSRSGSASSINHHDRLLFLVREGNRWVCYKPATGIKPPRDSTDSDYQSTQVPGVTVNTLFSTQGGRGHESKYKKRYKITRDLVESFEEIWMIKYRSEVGGSLNGEYDRIKNATATKLCTEE